MKKIFIAIILLMFASSAVAEDLSSLSASELLALREKIDQKLWQMENMKVFVPEGTYEFGLDIPVGKYTIYSNVTDTTTFGADIRITNRICTDGKVDYIDPRTEYIRVYLPIQNDKLVDMMDSKEWIITEKYSFVAKEGEYIVVDDWSDGVIFTPYLGNDNIEFWGVD